LQEAQANFSDYSSHWFRRSILPPFAFGPFARSLAPYFSQPEVHGLTTRGPWAHNQRSMGLVQVLIEELSTGLTLPARKRQFTD